MSNRPLIGLIALSAAVGLACSSGGGDKDTTGPGDQGSNASSSTTQPEGKKTIVLEVTGPKKADITYGLNQDQSQTGDATVPWKKTLTTSEDLTIVTLLAQNKGKGKISCKITMNGKVVKTNTSEGEFAIVTCTADNL